MKKYFLTGLVTLLPLVTTLWILQFLINFLTKPFIGVVTMLTYKLPIHSPKLIETISQALILIGFFFLLLFLGFVARRFFFSQLIRFGDNLLHKIPLINKVYKTSKEIVTSFFGTEEKVFSQVVMMPFPSKGSYCLGLIAKEAPKSCSKAEKEDLVSVFIPTTPNPSTGYLMMCKKEELIYLNMKTEDAVKYVVSCGVIQPERRP
jgi:uncharacterized membrane protein